MRSHLVQASLVLALLASLAGLPVAPAVADCPEGVPNVYFGGSVDDFALPTDPTYRRPVFDARPDSTWKDFDDPDVNAFVGHTFESLPGDVVRAELAIRMQPGPELSTNDSLALIYSPGNRSVFFSRIRDLPGASPATGGTWDTFSNGPTEFIFDLGSLPVGPEILARINADRYLDLLVADDTTVDWVRLSLWTCPPRTLWADRLDDFSPPGSTNPQRSQALEDRFPDATWKGFDDDTSNRFFGHTFSSLPANVVRARLTLRLRPHRDIPRNDGLSLGLAPGEPSFFSSLIEDLPEAGGSWERGDPPATFTLELGELPMGAELLAFINDERRLDVLVVDDTAVDYLRLELWTCPPPTTVSGRNVFKLGDAELENLDRNTYVVQGFNGVGFDGIEIDLDGADGDCIGTGMLCLEEGGVGTAVELAAMGTVDTNTPIPEEFAKLQMENTGNDVQVSAEFPGFPGFPGGAPMSVSVFEAGPNPVVSNGPLVREHWAPIEGPAVSLPLDACFTELDWYLFHESTASNDPNTYCFRLLLKEPTSIDILQGGPSNVEGSIIEICPPLVTGIPPRLSSLQLTAEGLPSLTLTPSALRAFGTNVQSVGPARLSAFDGGVAVSGLSRDGGEGLAIRLDEALTARVGVRPQGEGVEDPGAYLQVAAEGVLDGTADQPLGHLRITRAAEGFEAQADFSDLNTTTQRVQILDGGDVVFDATGPVGEIIGASNWPDRLGKLNSTLECYVAEFPLDTLFTLPGSPGSAGEVAGSELRVLAEGTAGRVGTKSLLQVTGGGFPDLVVSDLVTATACEPSETRLCLNGGRFAVEAEWARNNGLRGRATAVPLTDDTGYFWFFREENVEMIVKALEGCSNNSRFWVFGGGLTNVEVNLQVTDTVTGDVRTYQNPQLAPFQPLQDTDAFDTCSAPVPSSSPISGGGLLEMAPELQSQGTALLLNDGRFRVETRWRRVNGTTGDGQAVQLTEDTGYFWFFDEENVEAVVKVLRGCPGNGRYWVFAGGLTNVEVEMTVTDTQTGQVKTYLNPLRSPFQPIQDTQAFATCP